MIDVLIYLLVVAVLIALIWYVVDALNVPPPLGKVIKVIAVVVGCIVVIYALLGLTDVALPPRRP